MVDSTRRGFFKVPLAAVLATTSPSSIAPWVPIPKTEVIEGPKAGDFVRVPAGVVVVEIDGREYELYLFDHKKETT